MSPIDDELRAALHGRAAAVAPSPDPLAGIEQRAKRLRRNRMAASVAGSALAVALIAAAVPTLQMTAGGRTDVPRVAASSPPETARPVGAPYVLDPEDPWEYRGDPGVLADGNRGTYASEWGERHGLSEAEVTFSPLYGQLGTPAQQATLVYLARGDGRVWWGVVQSSESGPEFLLDQELVPGTRALPAVLPDEVPRLLVVAAPDVGDIQYGPNDATEFHPMDLLAPGVAVRPMDGDPATDSYRVLDPTGMVEVVRAPAPDPQPGRGDEPAESPAPDRPDNLLDWGFRGQEDAELEARALQAYARSKGVAPDDVGWFVLFTGDNDPGQRFTLLQVWVRGKPAQVIGFIDHPALADELVLRPLTDPDAPVVALLLTETPGRTVDELVIVPTPGTGQVLYAADGDAEARAVEPAPGLDGVVLIDRARGVEDDRLTVLDGNGNLDRPLYDGPVAALLCGESGCG